MSILLVAVVSQGIVFAADRNVTATKMEGTIPRDFQIQERKVFVWPQRNALIGYVGCAVLGGSTQQWLTGFIARNLSLGSFDDLSKRLRNEVETQRRIDEGSYPPELLVIHLAGFEEREDIRVPVVHFVTKAYGLAPGPTSYTDIRKVFKSSEELWRYFPEVKPHEIRDKLKARESAYDPFWFHHGLDLQTFNTIEAYLKGTFKTLCDTPSDRHRFPRNLSDWEKQAKMAVLTYGAYFQAYKEDSQQDVGGGATIESIPLAERVEGTVLQLTEATTN